MKAQRLDVITTLPQSIIEAILCLLPIEEAARTSILSKEWRFKWTTIPKLVFLGNTVKSSNEAWHLSNPKHIYKERSGKLFSAIHQVLLQRQGPIHGFTLSMTAGPTFFEIDQIILHLSRNHTVSKLTLELNNFSLPMSLFSLPRLTDLSLKGCSFNYEQAINRFNNLTSLSLRTVWMSIEILLHFLSLCPSLKSFSMLAQNDPFQGSYTTPTVMEFFKCLPVIEYLSTSRYLSQYGIQVSVPEEFTTSLIHLKYYCFNEMRVAEPDGWTFLMVLIQCSPNLEKIKLVMDIDVDDCDVESITFEAYSDVWLEHLIELEVIDYSNLQPELEFLKFILAKSPNLKKVILVTWMDDKDQELEMLKDLLCAPRASPVKIIVT